jgi:hypothetical protein
MSMKISVAAGLSWLESFFPCGRCFEIPEGGGHWQLLVADRFNPGQTSQDRSDQWRKKQFQTGLKEQQIDHEKSECA